MLRIVHVSYHTNPLEQPGSVRAGGMNIALHHLSREMAQQGHRIAVVSSTPASTSKTCDCGGYEIYVFPRTHFKEQFASFLASFAPDILHIHYWESGVQCLPWLGQFPMVMSFHTLGRAKAQAGVPLDPTRDRYEELLVHLTDLIVALSACEREDLLTLYGAEPDRVMTIHYGVDLERFRPLPPRECLQRIGLDRPYLLFVGRFVPEKGLAILLQALAMLDLAIPLVVVGGTTSEINQFRDQHRSLLAVLGDRVRFMGMQPPEVMPWFYGGAVAVVIPSLYESFGLVALESMACGIPIIASNTGGLRGIVQDGTTGRLFPPGDTAALAKAIQEVWHSPDKRRGWAQAAFQRAKEFPWSKSAALHLEAYQMVLQGELPCPSTAQPCEARR